MESIIMRGRIKSLQCTTMHTSGTLTGLLKKAVKIATARSKVPLPTATNQLLSFIIREEGKIK